MFYKGIEHSNWNFWTVEENGSVSHPPFSYEIFKNIFKAAMFSII